MCATGIGFFPLTNAHSTPHGGPCEYKGDIYLKVIGLVWKYMYELWCRVILRDVRNEYIYFHTKPKTFLYTRYNASFTSVANVSQQWWFSDYSSGYMANREVISMDSDNFADLKCKSETQNTCSSKIYLEKKDSEKWLQTDLISNWKISSEKKCTI